MKCDGSYFHDTLKGFNFGLSPLVYNGTAARILALAAVVQNARAKTKWKVSLTEIDCLGSNNTMAPGGDGYLAQFLTLTINRIRDDGIPSGIMNNAYTRMDKGLWLECAGAQGLQD